MATGHTPSRKHPEWWGGNIPWMTVGDARWVNGAVIRETAEFTNPMGIANSAAVVLPPDTVCLSRTGSIGYSVRLGRAMATSQGFVNWMCGPHLLPGYLQYLFLAENSFLHRISEGVAHTTIYFPEAKAFHIALPPLPEQRRIVEALETHFTRLDAVVVTLERVRGNLKRYRAAVLQAAVAGRLGARGVSVGRLPNGWRRERMPALATIVSGNTPEGIAGVVSETGELPWFRVGDMNEPGNEVRLHRSRTWMSRADAVELGLRVLPIGTIVFPKRGGAIRTNKKRLLTRDSTIDLNTMALVPEPGLGRWLWLWIQQLDLGTLADGSNVPQINHSDVAPLEVPLPQPRERDEILDRAEQYLSDIDAAGEQVGRGVARCARIHQSILRVAFEGRLVPQDPRDEPASVLLERIRTERAAAPSSPKKSARSRR